MNIQDSPLFKGIINDAEKKSEAIIAEANKEAFHLLKDAEEEARRAVELEQRGTELRLESIKLKEESNKRNMERTLALKSLNAGYEEVMKTVDALLAEKLKDEEWTNRVLTCLIAEAALGLGMEEALVSSSYKAKASDEVLSAAEALVKAKTGAVITLKQNKKLLSEFGVVLSSLDGKVSYDNRISTRMSHMAREIRGIVRERLCKAE